METARQTPPMGHNQPPSDMELLNNRLQADYADMEARIAELYEASKRVPDIKSQDMADKTTLLIGIITKADKNAENCRTEEKKPFLEQGRVVDAFFKPYSDTLSKAKANASQKLTVYQVAQKKAADEAAAAERKRLTAEQAKLAASQNAIDQARAEELAKQAEKVKAVDTSTRTDYGQTASLRKHTVFEIVDRGKIPTDVLQKYLSDDAIIAAVRAAHKDGVKEIPGINITEEQKAVVRA